MTTRHALVLLGLFLGSAPAAADDVAPTLPADLQRVWVGKDFWANRLADWQLSAGRIECLEAREDFPLRTLALLTASLGEREGAFRLSVRLGTLDPVKGAFAQGFAGFLVGTGGASADPRAAALVHHVPAEGGGLLAVCDAAGRVLFRDLSQRPPRVGSLALTGPLTPAEIPVLTPTSQQHQARRGGLERPLDLVLEGSPAEGGLRLVLSARDAQSGELLSEAVWEGVDPRRVAGGAALVSHLGARGGQAGHWFSDWTLSGEAVRSHPERAFGPLMGVLYSVSGDVLELTAQTGPLGPADTQDATLETRTTDGAWTPVAQARLDPDAAQFAFRVPGWDPSADVPFRVVYELAVGGGARERHELSGRVRGAAAAQDDLLIATLCGQRVAPADLRWDRGGLWFPHAELVAAVAAHDPDLLFFAGEQVVPGDFDPPVLLPEDAALLDYLGGWLRWCWAFGELTRNRPTIVLPSPRDLYQERLWGLGGKPAAPDRERRISAQDVGGYRRTPRFVGVVRRTQSGHLPDPLEPAPDSGLGSAFTRLEWAGASFVLLDDRHFKSSPHALLPEGQVREGRLRDPAFAGSEAADPPGAELLGESQLAFLREWALDWPGGTWTKVALSVAPFSDLAALVEAGEPFEMARANGPDAHSNAWPPRGRRRALEELRRAGALHLAGESRVGSLGQYGLADWGDAGFVFTAPALASSGTLALPPGASALGDQTDGFGNRLSVRALGAAPGGAVALGYGLVRLQRATGEQTFSCWPRPATLQPGAPAPLPGWPVSVHALEALSGGEVGWLPEIVVEGLPTPVVRVEREDGEVEYVLRLPEVGRVRLPVRGGGAYRVGLGEPGTERWHVLEGLRPTPAGAPGGEPLTVTF